LRYAARASTPLASCCRLRDFRNLTCQSVSQSVIKQIGAAPDFTWCGRATLTPVLEYLVTEPPLKAMGRHTICHVPFELVNQPYLLEPRLEFEVGFQGGATARPPSTCLVSTAQRSSDTPRVLRGRWGATASERHRGRHHHLLSPRKPTTWRSWLDSLLSKVHSCMGPQSIPYFPLHVRAVCGRVCAGAFGMRDVHDCVAVTNAV
jgi:hypothetical protein